MSCSKKLSQSQKTHQYDGLTSLLLSPVLRSVVSAGGAVVSLRLWTWGPSCTLVHRPLGRLSFAGWNGVVSGSNWRKGKRPAGKQVRCLQAYPGNGTPYRQEAATWPHLTARTPSHVIWWCASEKDGRTLVWWMSNGYHENGYLWAGREF